MIIGYDLQKKRNKKKGSRKIQDKTSREEINETREMKKENGWVFFHKKSKERVGFNTPRRKKTRNLRLIPNKINIST